MNTAGGNFLKLFFSLNVLLIFIPLSLYLEYFRPQAHTLIFFSACLGIIPLAGWMGKATEQIADRAGEGIGGLLNATFGNAAELIIAIVALRAGYLDIVKASLTGSIIGNILLVLGASFLAGGLRYKIQEYNVISARAQAQMLLLTSVAIITPALFHFLRPAEIAVNEAAISLALAGPAHGRVCLQPHLFSAHPQRVISEWPAGGGGWGERARCLELTGGFVSLGDCHYFHRLAQ